MGHSRSLQGVWGCSCDIGSRQGAAPPAPTPDHAVWKVLTSCLSRCSRRCNGAAATESHAPSSPSLKHGWLDREPHCPGQQAEVHPAGSLRRDGWVSRCTSKHMTARLAPRCTRSQRTAVWNCCAVAVTAAISSTVLAVHVQLRMKVAVGDNCAVWLQAPTLTDSAGRNLSRSRDCSLHYRKHAMPAFLLWCCHPCHGSSACCGPPAGEFAGHTSSVHALGSQCNVV